jgi:hypothetical protein
MANRYTAFRVSPGDVAMMRAVEKFIRSYDGDNLLYDIDAVFPNLSFRCFFIAFYRARNLIRWLEPEGAA